MKRAISVLLLAGCAKPIPRPTLADVTRARETRPETTLVELERGRERYVARCGGCHQLYQPSAYDAADWPTQVDEMAERSKLGTDDRELIVRFLVTLSTRLR